MKTNIHHIELSHTSPNISGGETAMLEIIRHLNSDSDIVQYVYTSETGRAVYAKLLGKDAERIKFVVIGKKWVEKISEYGAYFLRIVEQLFYLRRFDSSVKNVIFSHEGFLPTGVFAYFLKKMNKNAKWLAFFHMKSPSIWKGFAGEYVGKFKFPTLGIIRYKLEELVFLRLTKNNVDELITVNTCYSNFLSRIYKNHHVLEFFGGVDAGKIEIKRAKKYDLSFLGRFHEQKGISEIVDIVKRLKIQKPDISLVVMGGRDKAIEDSFFELIRKEDLEKNITYLGYVLGDEKYSILAQSRAFLFPSHYESFGLVALEAMRCGLPVVAYDLPPLQVFRRGMLKVPILDNQRMAKEILKLLKDEKYYSQMKNEAIDFSSNFSWEKTGEEIKKLIQK